MEDFDSLETEKEFEVVYLEDIYDQIAKGEDVDYENRNIRYKPDIELSDIDSDIKIEQVRGYIRLINCKIDVYLNFDYANFDQAVIFKSTTFCDEVSFISATFNNLADFSSTIFIEKINFESAKFNGETDFKLAIFCNQVKFRSVDFNSDAVFESTYFVQSANFNSTNFVQHVYFNKAWFVKLVDFQSVSFNGDADFSLAIFDNDVNFGSAKFNRNVNLEKIGHSTVSPESSDIIGEALKRSFLPAGYFYEKAAYPYFENKDYSKASNSFRNAKIEYEKEDNYEKAIEAYIKEKESTRKSTQSKIRKIKYYFWWITCNYGENYWLLTLWIIGIILFFALIYTPLGFLGSSWASITFKEYPYTKCNCFLTALYFSVVTFSTLGFGDITPISGAGKIWVILEVLSGYVMLGILMTLVARKMTR